MKMFLIATFFPLVTLAHGDLEKITCKPSKEGLDISLEKEKGAYNLKYQKSSADTSTTRNVTLMFRDEIENRQGQMPTVYDNITFKEKSAPNVRFRVLEDHTKEVRPAQAFLADATLDCTAHF